MPASVTPSTPSRPARWQGREGGKTAWLWQYARLCPLHRPTDDALDRQRVVLARSDGEERPQPVEEKDKGRLESYAKNPRELWVDAQVARNRNGKGKGKHDDEDG